MPQLDFSTYPSQIFWLIVSFFSLYMLMSRWVIPAISDVVDGRNEKLKEDLALAREARANAEKLKNELKNANNQARKSARDIIAEAESEIKQINQKNSEEIAQSTKKLMDAADKEISAAKKKALEELAGVSSELAIQISDTVASVKASKEQADAKVSKALKEAA